MIFSVLHASISGMSLPDSWKSTFVDDIGVGESGLNYTSLMEVDVFFVF